MPELRGSDAITADVITLLLVVMIVIQLAGRKHLHYLPGLTLLAVCVLLAGVSLRIWPS